MELEIFDFSDHFIDFIRDSDLIISHAGAGSILETLRMPGEKKLMVRKLTLTPIKLCKQF